jgi:hypothetical protein
MSNARSNQTTLAKYLAPSGGDDAPAIAAAFATHKRVVLTAGTFMAGSTINVPDNKTLAGEGLGSILAKGANGAVVSLGRNARVVDLYIDGNSVNYTGVGITLPFTAEFEGYQQILNCRVYYTQSYCVEYAAAMAGFGSKIADCDFAVSANTVVCIKLPADGTNKHGNRSVLNCTAGSGPFIDISGAENTFIIGNTLGDNGVTAGILWSAATAKAIVIGNRIACTTAMTLNGQSNVFSGNVVASSVTLAAGWIGSRYADNVITGTLTDSSGGQQNEVDTVPTGYTPAWTGGSTNPVLNNGSLYGVYTRKGRLVMLTLGLDIGSTTTMGSGEWRFSLPTGVSSAQPAWGSALMYDATGTPVVGVLYVAASSTYGVVYMQGVAGTMSSGAPFTWASGDFLRASCTYLSA